MNNSRAFVTCTPYSRITNQSISQSINQSINCISRCAPINHYKQSINRNRYRRPKYPLITLIVPSQPISQSIDQRKHHTVRQSIHEVKHLLSDFFSGTKQLIKNAKISLEIKKKLRNQSVSRSTSQSLNESSSQSINQSISQSTSQSINQSVNQPMALTRAERRHLTQTRIDLMTGSILIASFFVPIIGNFVPVLGSFIPRLMPSVFQSINQSRDLMIEDANLCYQIVDKLRELIQRSNQSINQSINQSVIDSMLTSKSCTELASYHTVFDSLSINQSINQLDRKSLRQLLKSINQHSVFLVLLPKSVLVRLIDRWSMNILIDDRQLLIENAELSINQSISACHERGLYLTACSQEFTQLLQMQHSSVKCSQESINQSTSQVKKMFRKELDDWLTMTSTNQSINQSINQSNNQSNNQSINQSVSQCSTMLMCHAGAIVFRANQSIKKK